ncbi:MAG: 2-dehydropantoate 2-reductase [Pseudomonadota bacterium]|nr:MAG: 2-dehydropantoate 2-reductase [Pseudomonadota bacterium]
MKICVVGAGAIGGYMGVKLALAGHEVTLIARGAHLDAIKKNGLRLILEDGSELLAKDVKATSKIAEAGKQDMVILGLKAHQVGAVAKELSSMFGPDTTLIATQNGIPWWYFQKHGGEFEGRRVETVDPNGEIMASIDVNRIIGCVVYPAAEITEPGVIRHIEGNRFSVGELDGAETPRIKQISETFTQAGMKSPILSNVRAEIWLKLWGNLSFNPISALTHATLVDICQFPLTRNLAAAMMTEAQTIANKLGIQFRVPLEKRIAGAEAVGKHKTSMLQDIEGGRPIELEALVGSVVELGRLTQTPTPHIDAVYACASLLAKTVGEVRGRLQIQS